MGEDVTIWYNHEGDDLEVLYEIDDHAMVVRVLRIRHRRDAYR
jgi:mRNA-degrading endonuclease RelE of RelBE toxin-antitoxin system